MSPTPRNPDPNDSTAFTSGESFPLAPGPDVGPVAAPRASEPDVGDWTARVAGPGTLRGPEPVAGRSEPRRFFAMIVIGASTAMALGLTLKMPTQIGAWEQRENVDWALVDAAVRSVLR